MSSASWRTTYLLREAGRNIFSLHSRLATLASIAIVLGIAAPLYTAFETASLEARLVDLHSKGRNVVLFEAANRSSPTLISRASCEALASEPGIERAGLLNPGDSADFPQLGKNMQVLQASRTLFPDLSKADALIGSAIRGAPSGGVLAHNGAPIETHKAPVQPEGVHTNSAIVVSLQRDTKSGDTCVVILSRFQRAAEMTPRLAAELAVSGGAIVGRAQLTESLDAVAEFESRPTRFLPLALGAAGALAAMLLIWSRSSEFAAYRLSGTSRTSLAILIGFEQALIAGCLVVAGSAATFVLKSYLLRPSEAIAWTVCAGGAWMGASLTASLKPVLTRASTLAKDR